MPTLQSLSLQRDDLVARIAALGPMRPGTLCAQKVKYRAKDGTAKLNGPYPILTFKEKGNKTRTIRLRSLEQGEIAGQQIEAFREFKRLIRELIQVGQEMADLEMAQESHAKKNSSNALKRSRKGKRPRSSTA